MRREVVLELLALVWLAGSIVAGLVIIVSEEYIIGFAVVVQGSVFSVFLLVFAELAGTIFMLDSRVKSLSDNLQEIANKTERPAQPIAKVTPVATNSNEGNTAIKEDISSFIKNNEDIDDDCPYCGEDMKLGATKCKHCHEKVFVSTIALVSLRSGPDDNKPYVAEIEKGMELVLLDNQNEWAKVQAKDGTEGWIKDIYVYKI
jgi:hypothetical protein